MWLSELSAEMKETLKHLLYECVSAGKKGAVDPSRYPSQVRIVLSILFEDTVITVLFVYLQAKVCKLFIFGIDTMSGRPDPVYRRCRKSSKRAKLASAGGGTQWQIGTLHYSGHKL